LRGLADTHFDLLIVGAGIYGATIAWDAAQRGLSVALIDRGDFGGGTSANSMKTVQHGGVRALQTLNLTQVRFFVRERRALSRIAPHLINTLPFIIPTYGRPMRNPLVPRVVFGLYDLVSRDRNDLPNRSKHLPSSRLVSREECLTLNPAIAPDGVTGESSGTTARCTTRTAWCWRSCCRRSPPAVRSRRPSGLAKQLNLVTRSITRDHALDGLEGSQFLFAAPWRDVSIVGTSQKPFEGRTDVLRVRETDVAEFLRKVNQAFPVAGLTRDDVRLVHRGLLPAIDGSGRLLLKKNVVRDHRVDGAPGLMSVLGVRYTTARGTAERATDTAFSILGRRPPACRTAETPLRGGRWYSTRSRRRGC